MKRLLLLPLLAAAAVSHAQKAAPLTAAQKHPTLPAMEVLSLDSASVFNTFTLPEGQSTLIFLFSPDCDHCGMDADSVVQFLKEKPALHVVATSFAPLAAIRQFTAAHGLSNGSNLTVGKDPYTFVPRFYDVKFFPFFALYDRNKKLVQTWDGGLKWSELRRLVQ